MAFHPKRPFRRVAAETCTFLLHDLAHPEGAFFSSQDADSEGEEGRSYVWSWVELVGLVGEDAARAFGASEQGNWEGTNVLTRMGGWNPEDEPDLEAARIALLEARAARVQPAIDDKVLAGWNGLAIGALATCGWALDDPTLVEAASRAAAFVRTHLVDDDGRLHRSWRGGVLGPLAVAEDHGLLADGLLTLYGATGDVRWFRWARELCEALLERFEDPEHGGFFTTARDAEALVVRPKDLQDNAIPSGNSAAAEALLRLASLTGDVRYERAATGALALLSTIAHEAPGGFGTALGALARIHAPRVEVAVIGDVGDGGNPRARALLAEVLGRRHLPFAVVASARASEVAGLEAELPLFAGRGDDAAPIAYVCERFACRMPVTTPEALAAQLEG